ncbi:D-alanyl-D-alanine carboxypeptidase family protein [Murimonas intestini]|uniref:D-alanyl-D-alanine carboxypeptidase family protein n=1 Tax=Murimonas intestini TaxID=1337051 RepID=UPI001652207F|nr:D-alanyl-D-alanine carboxypeptidase family protein [Murimonas intestini]
MKKSKIRILSLVILVSVLLAGVPAGYVMASAQDGETVHDGDGQTDGQDGGEESAEEETEYIPESYYLPIESNKIKGWPQGKQIEAEAAAVMDASTGAFLYSKNAEAKEYPASITKIMTALVALENSSLDEEVTYSEIVFNIEFGSSHLGIQPGEKMTMEDALYGLMLESANDIAMGIAEHVAGSVDGFVQMMNDKAAQLGCVNTHFANPHGLFDEQHYTCARDMAIITQAAIANPTFCKITGTVEYTIEKTNKVDENRYLLNHQKMLYDDEFKYDGCLGGKTGFVTESLNTLVTFAQKDDKKLICIILKVNGSGKTFTETADLLDYGFTNFVNQDVKNPEANMSRAELMGICSFGKMGMMTDEELKKPAFIVNENTEVTVPAGTDPSAVKRKIEGQQAVYMYENWPVGEDQISLAPAAFNVSLPKASETYLKYQDRVPQTEESEGFIDNAVGTVQSVWNRFWGWIYDNDLLAALIVLILLLVLIPILVIGIVRNHNSQKIRKQRQREKEERIKREEEIDRKSTLEIEAELRAEIEADRLRREEEAARMMEEEKEEKEIEEAEKFIEQREAIEEAGSVNVKDVGQVTAEGGQDEEEEEQV